MQGPLLIPEWFSSVYWPSQLCSHRCQLHLWLRVGFPWVTTSGRYRLVPFRYVWLLIVLQFWLTFKSMHKDDLFSRRPTATSARSSVCVESPPLSRLSGPSPLLTGVMSLMQLCIWFCLPRSYEVDLTSILLRSSPLSMSSLWSWSLKDSGICRIFLRQEASMIASVYKRTSCSFKREVETIGSMFLLMKPMYSICRWPVSTNLTNRISYCPE